MKYTKVDKKIKEKIESLVTGNVYYKEEINKDFFQDEMPIYGLGKPELVVDINSKEEVVEIVKICYENNIPIVTRGAGTGLTGSSVAIEGGVLLNMIKFNKVLDFDEENFLVTVEPGIRLKELQSLCLKKGYMYPPDPGEKTATIGGNVSTNAGGMRAIKYGTTRSYVREVEVVLSTGEVTKFGSKVSKSSSGYSLVNLIIGSEGTLGIITKIVLKIIPAPKYEVSIIAPFDNINDCLKTVPELSLEKLDPQSVEFTEIETVEYAEDYTKKIVFEKDIKGIRPKSYLIVRFDGNDKDELINRANKASKVAFRNNALEVYVADNETRKKQLWGARDSFLEAIEARTKLLDECDVVVPVSELPYFINFVNEVKVNYDFNVVSFGHAGDGNLHIYTISNDMQIDDFKKQVNDFMNTIYKKAMELDGQISGEHGIGNGKKEYLKEYENNINLRIMREIKEVFDPKNILNPYKMI